MYLANAFSLNMLEGRGEYTIKVQSLTPQQAAEILAGASNIQNVIGHPDTDRLVRKMLEELGARNLPEGQRVTVVLRKGDMVVVAQYRGPRLPEGATTLPEGAQIEFYLVTIQ